MSFSSEHLKALVQSYLDGDSARFEAVTLQIAAKAARQGQHRFASDLKKLIESAHTTLAPMRNSPVALAQPRGELAELVTASYPNTRLSDVVVPADVQAKLHRTLHEQRQQADLIQHGFNPVHRLLLTGPPGTGKTMSARALAHELSLPLLTIRLDSVISKFMGETATKLRVLFDAAASQRAVYLFDEFDALGGDRAGNDVGEARRILNSFLVFLEACPPQSLIVAATNHSGLLDRALFRRFDLSVSFPMPTKDAAVEILQRRLRGINAEIVWPIVAEETSNLSPAELVAAAEHAAKAVILDGRSTVSTNDLVGALTERHKVAHA